MNWDKVKDAFYAVLFVAMINVPLFLVLTAQGHELTIW